MTNIQVKIASIFIQSLQKSGLLRSIQWIRYKAAFWEVKNTILEWKKIYPKKGIKDLSNIAVFNKRDKKDT